MTLDVGLIIAAAGMAVTLVSLAVAKVFAAGQRNQDVKDIKASIADLKNETIRNRTDSANAHQKLQDSLSASLQLHASADESRFQGIATGLVGVTTQLSNLQTVVAVNASGANSAASANPPRHRATGDGYLGCEARSQAARAHHPLTDAAGA